MQKKLDIVNLKMSEKSAFNDNKWLLIIIN